MSRAAQAQSVGVARKAERPQGRAAERLRQALGDLARTSDGKISVAELCRRADVSRNSLYRYHGEILERLRRLPKPTSRAERAKQDVVNKLRIESAALRKQLAQVAALVDHFYAAYQESQLLLKRRDRELADVRRGLKAMPQLVR